MMTQLQKAEAFRDLHDGPLFIMPNPWDVGSAKALAGCGFKALASTSFGFAATLGRTDGQISLDEVVDHARALAEATDLPVSMDLEHGYGDDPAAAALALRRVAAAGAVGGSIEDWRDGSFYDIGHATERVAAAVEAARALDFPFILTARAENYFRDNPDLDDTVRRLLAYEAAGADVLFVPMLANDKEIGEVCAAVSRPVSIMALPDMTVDGLAVAGVRRVSVPMLSLVAMNAAVAAATAIQSTGTFASLSP